MQCLCSHVYIVHIVYIQCNVDSYAVLLFNINGIFFMHLAYVICHMFMSLSITSMEVAQFEGKGTSSPVTHKSLLAEHVDLKEKYSQLQQQYAQLKVSNNIIKKNSLSFL